MTETSKRKQEINMRLAILGDYIRELTQELDVSKMEVLKLSNELKNLSIGEGE